MEQPDARKAPLLTAGPELSPPDASFNPIHEIPPYTTWEHRPLLGCIDTAYVPEIDKHFIRHWELSPLMPSVVLFIMLSSYAIFGGLALPRLTVTESISILIVLSLFLVLFLSSYLRIICTGPGYFPIYWQAGLGAPDPDDIYEISGIVSTPEQKEFVETHDPPPRSTFSRQARRYVLRPDHVCGWAASWIGKCNHKYFILFNLYGILYCGLFGAYAGRPAVEMFMQKQISAAAIVMGLYCIIACFFVLFTGRYLVNAVGNAISGITMWESWNQYQASQFDRGSALLNLEDVMGQGPSWRWICPVEPFPGRRGIELASGYVQYCDVPGAEGGSEAEA
jgi:hypothetical protein